MEERLTLELHKMRHGVDASAAGGAKRITLSTVFSYIVVAFVLVFALACIEQFAQLHKKKIDDKLNEDMQALLEERTPAAN